MDLQRTTPGVAQAWALRASPRAHDDPWELLRRQAEHNNRAVQDVWSEYRLRREELARNPLAP